MGTVELKIDDSFEPVKPSKRYLVKAATALLTLTFLEDSLRIYNLWDTQFKHVMAYTSTTEFNAKLFLLATFIIQMGAAFLLLPIGVDTKKRICFALLACVLIQPPMYGQLSNIVFVSMSIAQVGALLLLAASIRDEGRAQAGGWEVPGDWAWVKLLGRLMLTADFFVVYVLNLEESMSECFLNPSSIAALLLLISCMLVWVGFKTFLMATAVGVAVGVDTIFRFPYWAVPADRRDNVKFHFFQSLSLVGGMLLLAVHGPGQFSLDSLPDKST
mmetsp:Transcript_17006/g.40569  ORF Transcript_17006/g.40569 Transcript_17006/m.40569 type:complete len:273 (-) Transcript_17006:39-857(-)